MAAKWHKLYGEAAFATEFWKDTHEDHIDNQSTTEAGESEEENSEEFQNIAEAIKNTPAAQEFMGMIRENSFLRGLYDKYLSEHPFDTEQDMERGVAYLKNQLERETISNAKIGK